MLSKVVEMIMPVLGKSGKKRAGEAGKCNEDMEAGFSTSAPTLVYLYAPPTVGIYSPLASITEKRESEAS